MTQFGHEELLHVVITQREIQSQGKFRMCGSKGQTFSAAKGVEGGN